MPVTITVRAVPDEVRDALAARAALAGKSLQEYLSAELETLASRPSVLEAVMRARARARTYPPVGPADLMADLAHAELVELPVELWPWQATATRAWELGANLSSYDAAYVALAEETDAPLLTRDARLASALGIRARVELV